MSHHVPLFAVGFLLLAVGAGLFGVGIGHLARRYGASPWGIGFAIVPLAVATPVLAVMVTAAIQFRVSFAVGSFGVGMILGSNVVNVGLALGTAALLRPLAGSSRVVTAGISTVLAAVLLFWFVCRDSAIGRVDAGLLLVGLTAAVMYVVRNANEETEETKAKFGEWRFQRRPKWVAVLAALLGIAALAGGAILLLHETIQISRFELRAPRIFGPMAVALAASLAILWVTETAARNGHADLAIATVVGANLCNLLLVPGVAAIITPFAIHEQAIMNDIPAMVLITFLLLVPLLNGLQLSRWEGAILVLAYAGFTTWQLTGK